MAYALVGNVAIAGSANGATSSSVDTTGASLLVFHVSSYEGGPAPTVSDSKSNTWTGLTVKSSGEAESRIFYAANPTVGSGHTFTVSGTGIYFVAQIAYFSGADTSSPFDVQNGAGVFTTTVQTGSVTPSQDNSLIVTGISSGTSSQTFTIDSSFSITNQNAYSSGVNEGGALAYLIQTTASATNPTWTTANATYKAATIAVFKPAAGGGATTVECSSGSVVVTGQSATIRETTAVPCTAATVAVTGQQATIVESAGTSIECSAATVPITGQQATVVAPTHIECSAAGQPISVTNLLTYSEQFNQAVWSKNGLNVTPDATTAPDETSTAEKIVEDTSTTVHRFSRATTVTNGIPYVASVYVKRAELRYFGLKCGVVGQPTPVFDLQTGTVVESVGSIRAVGNGWYRCSATFTANAAEHLAYWTVLRNPTFVGESYLGDGSSGIYIWGAQLELGEDPTPYIKTEADPVTAQISTIRGQQATVIERTHIAASAATVPVTGQQATVVSRTHIAASPATVVVNGQQASITQILAGAVECSTATVPVTGQPATIIEYDRVECSPATVVVSGQQASLLQRTLIPSTAATVAVTGQQATVVGVERNAVECSAATVLVAGQQASITETAIVTTRVECSPSTVAVIGGTGNVVSISGLRSRRNRGRYVTYTEPTAGEPLPKLPHAPRRKARLADVLEFVPTPTPDRVEPTPAKVEAKPAVIKRPVPTEAQAAAKLLEGLAAAVRTDPAIAREVIEALMPILAPRVEAEDDEEELVLLLLSRFAA